MCFSTMDLPVHLVYVFPDSRHVLWFYEKLCDVLFVADDDRDVFSSTMIYIIQYKSI